MESGNYTKVTKFILLGLSSDPDLQVALFYIFLIIYMLTVIGNLLLIVTVRIDKRLHNPMNLFLVNLSFLDMCCTSTTIPKMLVNLQTANKSISFSGCFIQVYFYLFLAEAEATLLAFMAYDRYVAICNSLRYSTIMRPVTSSWMISASWLTGAITSSVDTYVLYCLKYCGSNIINHYFCEVPSLMQLSCSDVSLTNIVKLFSAILLLLVPVSFILFSYIYIIVAVYRIQSSRYKAFSVCVSHLIVVILFYGSAIIIYMKPQYRGNYLDKIFSVFYTAVIPMLNPLIYSLRNKDVHGALQNIGKSLVRSKIFKFPKD